MAQPVEAIGRLARAHVRTIAALHEATGFNKLITASKLRGFLGGVSIQEALEVFDSALAYAQTFEGRSRFAGQPRTRISDIPIDSTVGDPFGLDRRFRYDVRVDTPSGWRTAIVWTDRVPSRSELLNRALDDLRQKIGDSPGLRNLEREAEELGLGDFVINSVSRTY